MTPTRDQTGDPPLDELALSKLMRVLGPLKGRDVYDDTLQRAGLEQIHSPDDLHAFGEELAKRGGFEAAVGRLLAVAAVLRGATGQPRNTTSRASNALPPRQLFPGFLHFPLSQVPPLQSLFSLHF